MRSSMSMGRFAGVELVLFLSSSGAFQNAMSGRRPYICRYSHARQDRVGQRRQGSGFIQRRQTLRIVFVRFPRFVVENRGTVRRT